MGTPIPPEVTTTPVAAAGKREPLPRLALASSEGGGGGHPVVKVLAALAVVVAVIAAYVFFGEKPPAAVGEVTHLTAYPIHRASDAALARTPNAAKVETTFDQIIVVAEVRIHNQSQGPIFLSDMSALLSLPAEEDRSLAAGAGDYDRVFIAYPELAPARRQPLLRNTTIPAGATVEGQLIFNYPITKDQWDLRRSFDLTLSFVNRKDLTLSAPQ